MQTTNSHAAPAKPTAYEVWFKNQTTKKVCVVKVEPGQTPAQALSLRKARSLSKGHVWQMLKA